VSAPRKFDFLGGLRFFFESPGWAKHLAVLSLAGLLAFVLVGVPYLAGYMYRMAHRRAKGEPPLPPLDDVFGMFKDGLRSLLFTELQMLVFFLPAIVCALFALLLAPRADDFDAGYGTPPSPAMLLALFLSAILGGIGLLAGALYIPASHARFMATGTFRAAFDVNVNLAFIRRNVANIGLMYTQAIVASLLSNAGLILCVVGIYPATIWSILVLAWGEGEVIRCDPESIAAESVMPAGPSDRPYRS
jgi:hypothetical protein